MTERALSDAARPPSQRRPGRNWPGRALRTGRPLLVGRARPWAGALAVGCVALIVVPGVLFAHQRTADRLDHVIDAPIVTWFGGRQGLALWLVAPGSRVPALAVSAVIVVACLLAGRLNGALLAAAALPVAEAVTEKLLKPMVDRTILGAVSYPSGHTTAIVALAATVTVLLLLVPPRPAWARLARVLILAVAYALVIAVAVGLIGLRWHYFTDTVAGAAVGVGTVCGLALILDSRFIRRLLTLRGRVGDPSGRPGPSGREYPERLR